MTVTDSLTHVSQVNVVASAGGRAAGGPAAALFKNAAITHYGPDGVEKATVGTLSFENVQLAPDGSIAGGQITHSTATPDGKPVMEATLQLAPGGKLTQAEAKIYNHRDNGVSKIVSADLTSMQWTDTGKPGSGEIQLKTKHPVTGAQTASGKVVFQNEKLISGLVTHYSAQNPNAIESLTEMDYSGLNFLGLKVAGGQVKVTRKQPDQKVSSNSQVSFTEDGSGRIKQIQTANLDPGSGAVKSQVTADYGGISYDARNVIASGDVGIHVTARDQSPLSHAVVSFANAVPKTSQTWRFQGNQLAAKIVTDFSTATFDNQNRVVNSNIKVDLYDGRENLLSSTKVTYDQNGAVANKQTQAAPPAAAGRPVSYEDMAARWTATPGKAAEALQTAGQLAPPAADSTPGNAKKVFRSDGTLEELVVTTSENGVPVSAQVTHFDTDGKTVVSTYQVDFTKVVPGSGAGKPTGSVSIREFTRGTTLRSESVFSYN